MNFVLVSNGVCIQFLNTSKSSAVVASVEEVTISALGYLFTGVHVFESLFNYM